MKCVIFGGGGFIGSHVADRLLLDGHAVRIFERPRVKPYRNFDSHEQVEWVRGDLLSARDVNEAVAGADVVFHAASTTLPGPSNEDPIFDIQTNLVASVQLLDAMVKHAVPRLVFISSGGTVYGPPQYLPIDERHPTEPLVSHGINKLAIEKYILLYKRLCGIKPVILRVSNPYGLRQRTRDAQGVIAVFIDRALNGLPVEIWGDGSVIRDFLYISDLAEIIARAASYSGEESVFNVSSGAGTSVNELVGLLEDVLNTRITRRFLAPRSMDVHENVLSNRLAALELGWKPKVSLRDGLVRTAAWIRQVCAMNDGRAA
jgi:UDP-glucose 4-epimerase